MGPSDADQEHIFAVEVEAIRVLEAKAAVLRAQITRQKAGEDEEEAEERLATIESILAGLYGTRH
jgi:hypothetical protein